LKAVRSINGFQDLNGFDEAIHALFFQNNKTGNEMKLDAVKASMVEIKSTSTSTMTMVPPGAV
jgi:hypothetical protein